MQQSRDPISEQMHAHGRLERDGGPALPTSVLSVTLIGLYVGLEWLSFLHEHNDLPVTPWNPGLGVMFAAIILRGLPMGFVLFAGVVLAHLTVLRSELPLAVTLAMGAMTAVTYTIVALLMRGRLKLSTEFLRTRDVLVLSLAGLAGALVVSVQLWLLMLSIRQFQLSDIASTSLPLIVGDTIGIAVVTPLVLRAVMQGRRPEALSSRLVWEVAAYLLVTALILMLVVQPPGSQGHSLFYLLFVPVVIAGVRHGIDGACAALALAQLGLVSVLHWHGFDLTRFTEYQVLMLVLTLTGLIVGGLVSERQAADQNAEAARRRLQEVEAQAARTARFNLVSGMAAAIAHEINQPMTAARALARSVQELMRSPSGDAARADRNLAAAIEQIDHAAAVVSRMREFLRRGEPHFSTLDIKYVLGEAVALAQPMVKARQIDLDLNVPDTLPPVHGDRVQIGQVVINLIKNSVDAIPEGSKGAIQVHARMVDGERMIEIAVTDNGTGISAEHVDTLFEPLATSRLDGIGLGLSISKSIVQAHDGRIWLHASAPGRTEFRFTLPVANRRT